MTRSRLKTFNEQETEIMNKQENPEINKQESLIEDLTVNDGQMSEVKGGPLCHGTTVLAWARVDGSRL